MARTHFVKKARKDYPEAGIKKGESYYWWKFRYGGKHMSKEAPKASQLTQSEFLSRLYDVQDRLANISADNIEDIQTETESIAEELNEMASDCRDKHDNMPDGLQEGEVGQMLEERADACENAASELEGIDYDYDEQNALDEVREEVEEEFKNDGKLLSEDPQEIYEDDEEDFKDMTEVEREKALKEQAEENKAENIKVREEMEEEVAEREQEKKQERIQEIVEEIQNVSIDCQ
jgi:hypothetical protein